MATPSKSNDTETPLSVAPGTPHWAYSGRHGQRSHGQGYDYHDPTSLQRQGVGQSGYRTGNSITTFGVVGFRSDQSMVSTTHGEIRDLYLERRFGTTGSGEFDIMYDPDRSTGIPGDFRTTSEHGFDVCQVDFDIQTLNPGLSTIAPGQYRVKFEDGEKFKRLRVIIPYKTAVRDMAPAPLVDDYTYLVREKLTTFAGHTGDSHDVIKSTSWDDAWNTSAFKSLTVQHLKDVWRGFSNKDVSDLNQYFNNYLEQYVATYQIQTLPLPTSFIKPRGGKPEYEHWKTQYTIMDKDLGYTVGRTHFCWVVQRLYAKKQSERKRTTMTGGGSTCCDGTILKYHVYVQFDHRSGKSRHASYSTYTDYGMGEYGFFRAGSDPRWTSRYDLLWSPNGEEAPTSGFTQKKYNDHREALPQPFDVDYSTYSNAQGGVWKVLPPINHLELDDTSYNVMFTDIGTPVTDMLNNIPYFTLSATIPESTKASPWYGKINTNPWTDRSGTTKDPDYQKPVRGVFSKGNSHNYFFYNGQNDRCPDNGDLWCWGAAGLKASKNSPYGSAWCQMSDDPRFMNTGPGSLFRPDYFGYFDDLASIYDESLHGDDKSTLYDLRSFISSESDIQKNSKLRGYYKCCVDHNDRQLQFVLEKASPDSPIDLDQNVESLFLIDKKPAYSVSRHAEYDSTVDKRHNMSRVRVYRPYQSWGDTPADPPVLDQLFLPLGAHVDSDVQFVSLSAGSLQGGSAPSNGIISPVKPKPPVLSVEPSGPVSDIVFKNTAKTWTKRFKNVGGGELSVLLNTNPVPFESTSGLAYEEGLDTTTNTMTGAGDKLTDWSWNIVGSNGTNTWRQLGADPATFMLSAGEYVTVEFTSQNTTHADGYSVNTQYQINYPQPTGTQYDLIQFEITY